MFEWLEQEIGTIKTRRFHVIEGPADPALQPEIEESKIPLPRSYKEFVRRFGNAKLYREGNGYLVGVWAPLIKEQSSQGEELYGIGHYQSSTAYFKASRLRGEEESPVFEGSPSRQVQVADDFEAWLTKQCMAARRTYKKHRWAEIVAGPPPFTPEEQRIVEARRRFTWRVVGITPDRNFLIEVHNGAEMLLPFLSIGVRRRDSSPLGRIWVPVSHISPGQTVVVEREAYKTMVDPSGIELFAEADPEPEDRERYWEFKALSP
jgi:hypothetical protein